MRDILNFRGCKRIAIMGGTFDPIHYGHLVTAEAVRHEFGVERVIFIPTGRPPHKVEDAVTHNEHRYLMTVLATVTNPFFDVSRIEIDRPGFTYTIDTLTEIQKGCGSKTEIFFITGADAVQQMITWKDSEKLFNLCTFVAVSRPGYNKSSLWDSISEINSKFECKLHFLEVPALAISSSDIKARVKSAKPIKYLLPEAVEEYIYKFGLYKQDYEIKNFEKKLKSLMSKKRYTHTKAVAAEAEKLAKRYGADPQKALTAAMFHDLAKEYPDSEKKKLCKEYGIPLDPVLLKQLDLTHSFLSAEIAERNYKIKDEDILNAIKYHTTGRKNMSLLEKIVFLADIIEPNRDTFEELPLIRELAYTDINKAVYLSLKSTIEYNRKKGRLVHPLGLEALSSINEGGKLF